MYPTDPTEPNVTDQAPEAEPEQEQEQAPEAEPEQEQAPEAEQEQEQAPEAEPEQEQAPEQDATRRPRGFLESDVRRVTDRYVTGELTLPEGASLTPHYIGRRLQEIDELDEPPSTGAVSSVLKRWVEIGFIEVSETPFAFVGYTEAAFRDGLAHLKQAHVERKKAAREAAKAAQAAPAI